MRAVVFDARPQIPEPGLGWDLFSGALASQGELLLPVNGARASAPLVPTQGAVKARLNWESFVPAGADGRPYMTAHYYAEDRATPTANSGGNTSNGNAPSNLPIEQWVQTSWNLLLSAEIHWVQFRFSVSTYGAPGTRYRNLRLTLLR